MKVIFGLGNPGSDYSSTRHNVGFLFLDYLFEKLNFHKWSRKENYFFAEKNIQDQLIILIKPLTFMNLSGEVVSEFVENNNLPLNDMLVIHDELNIELGEFKIKNGGSAGGHNGIGSIIYHINSNQFTRLRIGVGNQFKSGEMVNYVLAKFSESEFLKLKIIFDNILPLIDAFLIGGKKTLLDENSKLIKSINEQRKQN
ncbi:MAG: aminoacyl-tRNA hydrolase [Chlorobiaceae bacterium]|nr:aminoacyl-tRNA hydrolase [Chlorobiaceae bacterium]MBA4309877.1 aminoacyl-tRNA hydrolase [Chlorobiaceae bacterium]